MTTNVVDNKANWCGYKGAAKRTRSLKTFPHNRCVLVQWMDAVASSGWSDDTKFNVQECFSVGFVIHEDDSCITVSGTISSTEHNTSMTIPKSWIMKTTEVKLTGA